ncbi:hypothetical protein AJ80_04925 [Polytolypa hystricis UAMH7299]|uniref:Glycosyl transferase family 1 domain-containing protein n=1 Tax=Polytolypa hystricis (strain UAMH7299) TaxID=1447883 RepID=A0A2B7Y6R5_POLH7|nr:hypothetical protein AJ80_04925 [Polytolypa hystricis UAMH7299]
MVKILHIDLVGWDGMRSHWWQWMLIGLILAAVCVGSLYILYSILCVFVKHFKSKPRAIAVPRQTSAKIAALSKCCLSLKLTRLELKRPSSFGVYLGRFDDPPTESQRRILSQWDLVIIDPLQPGTVSAVKSVDSCQALGRVDLGTLTSKNDSAARIVEIIEGTLLDVFRESSLVGILLAGWDDVFSDVLLRDILSAIHKLGLAIYLETSPPEFMTQTKALRTKCVAGLVIRNASILRNGEKRDYFQMTNLQSTVKAFVSESCFRDFVVMAWETVDDPNSVSNAVIKRSIQWCSFYSAITWIGSELALTNADLNHHTLEPLAAFGWLKEADVMEVHDTWRENFQFLSNQLDMAAWKSMEHLFPSLPTFLGSKGSKTSEEKPREIELIDSLRWASQLRTMHNPLSISETGVDYNTLGCFPLGSDASHAAFAEVLQSQIRFKRLGLLHPVASPKLQSIGTLVKSFHDEYLLSQWSHAPEVCSAMQELFIAISNESVRVYLGLDSGFRKDSQARFWAVYQNEAEGLDIYVSKKVQGLAGTVAHTFLSSKGIPRHICFEMETALACWCGDAVQPAGLSRRVVQDIDTLTPEENLLLLQELELTDAEQEILRTLCTFIKSRLLDLPTRDQLREACTVSYINGQATPESLIRSRISWYEDQGCQHPGLDEALALFLEVDTSMTRMLKCRDEDGILTVSRTLKEIVTGGKIDPYVDLFALSVFCTMRKGAFDEVYTEVTDRNPLFNNQSDQAAAFAESFAIGSRCESYFDVTPSVLGKMLSERFRNYYNEHQPPSWINGAPALATSYGGAQIDIDPDEVLKPMPQYQRFTFLSVFAIPALIDIVLLTATGRGLYLSAYMSFDEKESATTALMISLILSGAIGTWISVGGSYYLVSMAFPAMYMFVLSRLIAGLAFTALGGIVGLIGISIANGIVPGLIFFLYLFGLTAYLTIFASIACFSFPGSSFLSGRKVIMACIPFLFISPIVTLFADHDVIVYISVLYGFIILLALGLRSVGSKWITTFQNLRKTNDTEIKNWYLSKYANNDEKVFANLSDPAVMKLCREALYKDVIQETQKLLFKRSTTDALVKDLANDWKATNFIINWYCRYSDVQRPIAFTSSWNIQTKVALDTFLNTQKGIRLHNAFIHWRQASDEVGCGVLYFVIALLDKWIDMLSGVRLVGLAPALSDSLRISVGLGLAYYLIGAVLVDTKAQHLHSPAEATPIAIKSVQDIRGSQKYDVRMRRFMYWRTLMKFLAWHVWSLAITASMIWMLQDSLDAVVTFCAYVFAYTGLLWYQYTKIFCGSRTLKPLLIAVGIGLPIGIILKKLKPDFLYSGVIALMIATWTAAILSLRAAKISMPKKVKSPVELGVSYHAHTAPWSDPDWSQQELQAFHDKLSSSPSEDHLVIDPQKHPSAEIKSIIRSHIPNLEHQAAFPNAESIVDWLFDAWDNGTITIELVPAGALGPRIRALSCSSDESLKIWIECRSQVNDAINIKSDCQFIAETILHSVAEAISQIPHEYAQLWESFFTTGVSETMSRHLDREVDALLVWRWAKRELLKQLCFGFQCDIHWDRLPRHIRETIINRCLGNPCHISGKDWSWLQKKLCRFDTRNLEVHLARCDLGASAAMRIIDRVQWGIGDSAEGEVDETPKVIPHVATPLSFVRKPFSFIYHGLGTISKYFVIAMVADSEFQREFNYVVSRHPRWLRAPEVFLANLIWMYGKVTQNFFLRIFLFHRRDNVKQLWDEAKELTISWNGDIVIIRSLDGTFTGFKRAEKDGGFKLFQYQGLHKVEPEGRDKLAYISTYSKKMALTVKEELKSGNVTNEYHYDYVPSKTAGRLTKQQNPRLPVSRRCVRGENAQQTVYYNRRGLIEYGSYVRDSNLTRFKYHYRKSSRFGDELLRAEFVLLHLTCTVAWCAPPRHRPQKADRWIPHSKVMEATFVQGADVYENRWLYDHKFHPTIFTTLNGQKVQTPPMIEHDYLTVLKKPKLTSFVHDDPLFHSNTVKSSVFSKWLGLNVQRFPASTSAARSALWKAWKSNHSFDGVILQWMDEKLLRRDKVLRPYWRSRDRGNLESARKYLDRRADAVMASADLDDDISSWTSLAIKMSDLFNFGPGGDAVSHTKSREAGFDTSKTIHILASDNGTWPNEGGGVSACRRDMVNSLSSIKWHMICESAHDFGIPKHQTEQNVQTLKVVPLWGLDFLTPTHGLFKNRLDSEVDNIATAATDLDIQRNFIPILTALVKGARAVTLSNADIKQATRALINLNTYFHDSRHWGQVWTSEIVKEVWRELWVTQKMENSIPSSEWFDTELPTLGHLDTALDLWFRYLFIFSIPLPDKIPSIFQASHHSVSAAYGIVCKVKRKCVLQIWDHAISWRETNLVLSSALCKLPPFVRNSLLGLLRLTSVLVLHHADIILPCADFFNPEWEVEIGTCQGTLEHRNRFRRKVDPVVNGITDMQKFAPVKEIKALRPTVTMLSHVWYAKDIKTALLAADIIVNEWGFDDYHLDIYGAIDKAPTYSTECQELIASKGLRGKATLRGAADPIKVLENTWLFLNSSLSEGLPLALGEAALTGAPVVCTDVGASLRVLSDPDDFSRFSAVVAPNDARALARAQISLLALLGEWSKYADDTEPAPVLPSSPTREDVEKITRRMYDKSEQRRKLGMMTRAIVQKSFSGDRYLREHEQMLWIGKARKMMASREDRLVEPTIVPPAIEVVPPMVVDEEVITVPRRAIHSWRSSVATSFSGYGELSNLMDLELQENVRDSSGSFNSGASTEAESVIQLPTTGRNALPVFAPRASYRNSALLPNPGRVSWPSKRLQVKLSPSPSPSPSPSHNNVLRGLFREDLRAYRNSDVSSIARDDFWQSQLNKTDNGSIPRILS